MGLCTSGDEGDATMLFNARQTFMIALFEVFWTAFMLWWNGDYGFARTATMLW